MKASFRKKLWWSILAMSILPAASGSAMFVIEFCSTALGNGGFRYYWPVLVFSLVGVILSRFKLKKCYREEPSEFSGLWQLSIIDFYAMIVFTAALLATFRASSPKEFAPGGAIAGVILGIGFLVAILVATRFGIQNSVLKWFCAFGLLLKTLGLILVGIMLSNLISGIMVARIHGSDVGFSYMKQILNILNVFDASGWRTNALPRALLLGLPLGIAIGKIVDAQLSKSTEVFPAD